MQFSLSNPEQRPVSYEQFLKIGGEFIEAIRCELGDNTKIVIQAMDQEKAFPAEDKDDDAVAYKNEKATFLLSANLADVTQDVWRKAKQLEIIAVEDVPSSEKNPKMPAFASMKLVAKKMETVSFFTSRCRDNTFDVLMKENDAMVMGEYSSNTSACGKPGKHQLGS